MITVSGKKMVRQTTAPYTTYDDKGEVHVEDIVVRYFVRTARETRAHTEKMIQIGKDNPECIVWAADELLPRLESLPGLRLEGGGEFEINLENLESLTGENITAIERAITEHQAPKAPPDK